MSKDMIKCIICEVELKDKESWWVLAYNVLLKSTYCHPADDVDIDNTTKFEFHPVFCCGLEHVMEAENKVRQGVDPNGSSNT